MYLCIAAAAAALEYFPNSKIKLYARIIEKIREPTNSSCFSIKLANFMWLLL